MTHVPPALVHRLDRLARRAHAFHRFAHHPLCEPYAGEVVRVGRRTRVCRGCLFAAAGAVLGVLGALLPTPPRPAALALVLVAGAAAVPAAVAPSGTGPRRSKVLTRALPAAIAAATATLGLRAPGLGGPAIALMVTAVVLSVVALYRRRGPDRTPCRACREREAHRVCSGFRPMATREAAFRRLAGRLRATGPCAPPHAPLHGTRSMHHQR